MNFCWINETWIGKELPHKSWSGFWMTPLIPFSLFLKSVYFHQISSLCRSVKFLICRNKTMWGNLSANFPFLSLVLWPCRRVACLPFPSSMTNVWMMNRGVGNGKLKSFKSGWGILIEVLRAVCLTRLCRNRDLDKHFTFFYNVRMHMNIYTTVKKSFERSLFCSLHLIDQKTVKQSYCETFTI